MLGLEPRPRALLKADGPRSHVPSGILQLRSEQIMNAAPIRVARRAFPSDAQRVQRLARGIGIRRIVGN